MFKRKLSAMVSKFFQRTVLTHFTFVGIGYLILFGAWMCLFLAYGDYHRGFGPPPAPLVFLVTLAAAIYYSRCLTKYRPIPHNPIQQFHINFMVATYAIVVALSLAIPLSASLEYGHEATMWPLFAALYVFFAWRHVYAIDPPVVQDAYGRRMSAWALALFEAKKYRTRFRRSAQPWHRS
jgi:hypothetical protein